MVSKILWMLLSGKECMVAGRKIFKRTHIWRSVFVTRPWTQKYLRPRLTDGRCVYYVGNGGYSGTYIWGTRAIAGVLEAGVMCSFDYFGLC